VETLQGKPILEIYLGQNFDSSLAVRPDSQIGITYQNYAGFLAILNTQLGLTIPDVSPNKRILQYLKCLMKKDTPACFYHQSLTVDQFAVAKQLLHWRDDLYLASWDGAITGDNASPRLIDLASVEVLAQTDVAMNIGQSLQSILIALEKYQTQVVKIYLFDALAVLPYQWQQVINRLKVQGVNIIERNILTCENKGANDLHALQSHLLAFNQQKTKAASERLILSGDGSVLVITSQSKMTSAELISHYLATKQCTPSSVIIAESNAEILDQYFSKQNLARQGMNPSSHHRSVMQLLPLSLQLMWQPVDINKMLSFLVHPVNMIPAFACRILAKTVAAFPGSGSDAWNEDIQSIKDQAKIFGKSEEEINAIIERIDDWLCNITYDIEQGAPIVVVENKVEKISKYLQAHISSVSQRLSDDTLEQQERQLLEATQSLNHIALMHCTELSELLSALKENGEESISQLKLHQLLTWVTGTGASMPLINSEANAPRLTNACAQVIQPMDELIWWDLSVTKHKRYCPWSPSEVEYLTGQGLVFIDSKAQLAQQEQFALQAVLNARQQLVLILHKDAEHHFLWDQISTLSEGVATVCIEDELMTQEHKNFAHLNIQKQQQSHQPLPERKRWWDLGSGEHLSKRDTESYSSIDAFINSPYQWVLQYKARLRAGSLLSVSEGNQLKGNLTHHLFDVFFTQNASQWGSISSTELQSWLNHQFDHLITCEAATFLALGKKSELEEFRQTLYQSLTRLLDHLKSAKIKSIKMEDRNEAAFFAGDMTGDIDMLLTNQQGDEIVLDIKWGWEKGRAKSLEDNLHTQLVVYSYLRRQQTQAKLWPEQAFFIIETGNLLAQNNFTFPGAKVHAPLEGENAATLWLRLERSYQWRRAQLDKGLIEMTVTGTLPVGADSIPPTDALVIEEINDHFNNFKTLMGREN
jgi:ATP-dependent helicase/nuclease subunit B